MTRPNIVFLLLDAARADKLSCYDHNRVTSPFIDNLAMNGELYTQAYSNSIWSLPSYASIFTGEYPSVHGAVDWGQSINPQSNILVNKLNQSGYETHAVTTHLLTGEHGISDSFDETKWVNNPNRLPYPNDPVTKLVRQDVDAQEWSKDTIFNAISEAVRQRSWQVIPNGFAYMLRKWKHTTGRWEDDGAERIIDYSKEIVKDATDPFFLFANFVETHDPYRPPERFIFEYLPEEISIDEANEVAKSHLVNLSLETETLTDREREIMLALYDAEIRYIDSKIKEFVEFLKHQGEFENTLLIICSDHGDLFGEWGFWGHQGAIHRSLCRVPLIISTPWDCGNKNTYPVELRDLSRYIPQVAEGEQKSLPEKDGAIVEYHGWDCQISGDQWTKFSSHQRQKWSAYSASYITNEWQYLVNANGDSWLFPNSNLYPEEMDSTVDEIDIKNELRSKLVDTVGAPQENHEVYRNKIDNNSRFESVSDGVQEHLKDLGYA
ncbi:sulfatase [Haloferax prahovense]|uniref:sulfatase n=1 Tax=Haloferax prahovense TaxID=381852 RepID=UPI003C74C6DF